MATLADGQPDHLADPVTDSDADSAAHVEPNI